MKNILAIIAGSIFTLVSCDDSITISKSEYNKLKDIKSQTKRTVSFPEGSSASYDDWEIIQASDGHDYLENGGGNDFVIMHYIECGKCKKK